MATNRNTTIARHVDGETDEELAALDRLFEAVLRGESRALIIRGEAGIGKTTIIERFVATHAARQMKTCFGVDSEMELAWAGLHQLCSSMLEYLPTTRSPDSIALPCCQIRPNPTTEQA